MKISEELIWDYQFSPEERKEESFIKWYLVRLLTRGGMEDLEGAGLETIRRYFSTLDLPKAVKEFWGWYLGLPENRRRYGNPHSSSE